MYISPVSIYLCTICLIELTVALQNFKPVSCKMHCFSKMHLVVNCYTAVFYKSISKLYLYKNSALYLSDCRVTCFFFFFCKMQELRTRLRPFTILIVAEIILEESFLAYLQICNGCFTEVSTSWPMGLLLNV